MSESDDDEIVFGCLGTPFNIEEDESIENKRNKLKRKVAEEEVTDEKGRALRFHGAFTGGFSAGYYNTVGSKEGFVPQQFSSKRSEKGGLKRNYRDIYKPEDYMDDEDFSEHGIAPKILQMTNEYDDSSVRSQFRNMMGVNSIFGDNENIKNYLIPERLTIGLKLLKKLGYMPSKGVGERISDESNSDIDLDDSDNEKQYYRDKKYYKTKININDGKLDLKTKQMKQLKRFEYETESVFKLASKLDRFGIGYSGMDKNYFNNDNNNNKNGVNFGYKNKRGIQGVAFEGVDYDGEDDDIQIDFFAKDSMNNYNFELIDDDNDDGGGDRGGGGGRFARGKRYQGRGRGRDQQHSEFKRPPTFGWTAPKFANEKNIESGSIPGFNHAKSKSSISINTIHFEPLKPPRFYIPLYPARSSTKSESSQVGPQQFRNQARPKLMPEHEDESVFNLMTSQDKERLKNIVSGSSTRPIERKSNFSSRWGNKPMVQNDSVASLLTGVSTCMFKSAGKSSETQDIDYNYQKATGVDVNEGDDDVEDMKQRQEAARSGQYGFMTRRCFNWHPDKLICKRFNVPDPYPGCGFIGIEETNPISEEKENKSDNLLSIEQSKMEEDDKEELEKEEEVPVNDDHTTVTTVLDITTNQPPIDLFKSVFEASDDDLFDDDDDYEAEINKNHDDSVETTEQPNEANKGSGSIVSQIEQALGSFMGEDLKVEKSNKTSSGNTSFNTNSYGPELPPDYSEDDYTAPSKTVTTHLISRNLPKLEHPSSSDSEVVYKDPSKISKKKKKEKKRHNKKSKKSKKKSKRKRVVSDESSSSD